VKLQWSKILCFFILCIIQSAMAEEREFHPQVDCHEGSCVEELIARADELKFEINQNGCLPEETNLEEINLEEYFENNLFTEECVRLFGQVEENNNQIDLVFSYLDNKIELNQSCLVEMQEIMDTSGIEDLEAHVDGVNQCSDEIRAQHASQCGEDFRCALAAGAHTLTGPLGNFLGLQELGGENCDMTEDSCLVQLATGFVRAAFMFFEGAWDLLSMAGQGIANGLTNLWDWMRGVEEHSSTAQLAAAQASEEEGIFRMLVDDFPGTMARAWQGISEGLSVWMKENVFCQEWSGLPYHSECLTPAVGFDCLSCKQKFNGFCGISGIFLAEVVPAFFTGGMITAIKYGARGASRIARSIRVSDEAIAAVRSSSISQYATANYEAAARALANSRLARASGEALRTARRRLQRIVNRPSNQYYRRATATLHQLSQTNGATVFVTGSQRFFSFSGRILSTGFRAIIYPIDNPLTQRAYTLGLESFDNVFSLVQPVAITGGVRSYIAADRLHLMEEIDQQQITDSIRRSGTQEEPDNYVLLSSQRADIAQETFHSNFHHTIDELFPELSPNQGSTAARLNSAAALDEITNLVEQIPSPQARLRLSRSIQADQVQLPLNNGRRPATLEEILENSSLSDEARVQKAWRELNLDQGQLDPALIEQMQAGLLEAHRVGEGRGVFEYTFPELRLKRQTLLAAGFTSEQAYYLMRSGLAGRPPTRTILESTGSRVSDYYDELTLNTYDERHTDLISQYNLSRERHPQRFMSRLWNRLTGRDADYFPDQLEALHFIDYAHSSQQLTEFAILKTRSLRELDIAGRYGSTPFENYRATQAMLMSERPEISLETFRQIHTSMMRNGVEDLKPRDLGVMREREVFGRVSERSALDEKVVRNLAANPYLSFTIEGTTTSGHSYGKIFYPNFRTLETSPELLRRVEIVNPELANELREAYRVNQELSSQRVLLQQLENGAESSNPQQIARIRESIRLLERQHTAAAKRVGHYNRELTSALTEERFQWFHQRREALGDLDNADKVDDYIDLLAEFQRDLVSIHPVANGNGRSTRMLVLDYALRREGLPPATLLDPNLDIYGTLEDWQEAVRAGVLATHRRQQDLAERVRMGLPVENSLELATPFMPRPVTLPLRVQGSSVARTIQGVESVDPRTYRELVRREFERDPSLVGRMAREPQRTWQEIDESIATIVRENNIYFDHKKFGVERVELGIIDDDFIQLYGRSSYHDPELYHFKMDTWYEDSINWRGLASKTQEKSEEDILAMFRETNLHMASNRVVSQAGTRASPERIRELAIEDFRRYNDSLFTDDLVEMARDHSETGPLYGQSFGYSTSKNRDVGKAFAMGAMVVAEYGRHHEFQHLLQSRILVGAHRARKDVDLTRLKQVREDFSYRYGRQQEVMGVGAADPDSIRIIQRIDENGEVIVSYIRHHEQPNLILVVPGDADPLQNPDPDRIIQTIEL
jgi:Fic family protein